MQRSTVSLSFTCPKNWNFMEPHEDGRFCHDCKKTVKDYSREPLSKLAGAVPAATSHETCGSFYAYQLNKPFGSWKDNIISYYQRSVLAVPSNRSIRSISLFLLTIVLVATGCARRLSGRVCKDPKHKHGVKVESKE